MTIEYTAVAKEINGSDNLEISIDVSRINKMLYYTATMTDSSYRTKGTAKGYITKKILNLSIINISGANNIKNFSRGLGALLVYILALYGSKRMCNEYRITDVINTAVGFYYKTGFIPAPSSKMENDLKTEALTETLTETIFTKGNTEWQDGFDIKFKYARFSKCWSAKLDHVIFMNRRSMSEKWVINETFTKKRACVIV